MKSIFSIIILLFLVLFLESCKSSAKSEYIPLKDYIKMDYNYYKDKETFKYSASMGLFNAGILEIKCDSVVNINNTVCYKVESFAKSAGTVNRFTKLSNKWIGYIDTSSLLPIVSQRFIKENKYLKNEISVFNYIDKKAEITDLDDKKVDYSTIGEHINDISSAFFVLRNIPFSKLKINDTSRIDVFHDKECFNLKVCYRGKETIKYDKSKIECFIVSPVIPQNSIFKEKDPVKVWITNDDKRLPVRIQARFLFGSVTAILDEYTKIK